MQKWGQETTGGAGGFAATEAAKRACVSRRRARACASSCAFPSPKLMEMAAFIIPEGIEMEGPTLEKAREEGIAVLQSDRTAFELCALMAQAGLPGTPREA